MEVIQRVRIVEALLIRTTRFLPRREECVDCTAPGWRHRNDSGPRIVQMVERVAILMSGVRVPLVGL